MNFQNMRVSVKLLLGFSVILAQLLLISLLGYMAITQIDARLDNIVGGNMRKTELIHAMSEAVHLGAETMRTVIIVSDVKVLDGEIAKLPQITARYMAAAKLLAGLEKTAEGKAVQLRIHKAMEAALPVDMQVVTLAREGHESEAAELLMSRAEPLTLVWREALDDNIRLLQQSSQRDVGEAKASFTRIKTVAAALCIAAAAIGVLVAWIITRDLLARLGGEPEYAAGIARSIAAGDLTVEVATRRSDATSMLYALKMMRDDLSRIVTQVRTGTRTMDLATKEIASGILDLSSRTERQAGALQETVMLVEQLTAAVKTNAENARHANELAGQSSDVASQGGDAVGRVVDVMEAIQGSSRKVADIISVIDGIAFQTNILALNAAVEAARAGEQGRGFAVVASEVRTLAQRSAAAAREIKALIGDSVQHVERGTELAHQAGQTMTQIGARIREVTGIMGNISAASQQQSAGIDMLNKSILQIDNVTQQNAALVEEASAAAASLDQQAAGVSKLVSMFNVEESSAGSTRRTVPRLAIPGT
ncbi:MAG: methyl-accepting chemotaxis protein [Pseudomonadota bacterium]